jgi:hypothetical protein
MVKITFIAFDGAGRTVSVEPGKTLMEAVDHNGVDGIDAVLLLRRLPALRRRGMARQARAAWGPTS